MIETDEQTKRLIYYCVCGQPRPAHWNQKECPSCHSPDTWLADSSRYIVPLDVLVIGAEKNYEEELS